MGTTQGICEVLDTGCGAALLCGVTSSFSFQCPCQQVKPLTQGSSDTLLTCVIQVWLLRRFIYRFRVWPIPTKTHISFLAKTTQTVPWTSCQHVNTVIMSVCVEQVTSRKGTHTTGVRSSFRPCSPSGSLDTNTTFSTQASSVSSLVKLLILVYLVIIRLPYHYVINITLQLSGFQQFCKKVSVIWLGN